VGETRETERDAETETVTETATAMATTMATTMATAMAMVPDRWMRSERPERRERREGACAVREGVDMRSWEGKAMATAGCGMRGLSISSSLGKELDEGRDRDQRGRGFMTLGHGSVGWVRDRKGKGREGKGRDPTRPDSAHLVEQPQHLWHVELHILEIQHGLIIFLLKPANQLESARGVLQRCSAVSL
jgi:hypothetical protein